MSSMDPSDELPPADAPHVMLPSIDTPTLTKAELADLLFDRLGSPKTSRYRSRNAAGDIPGRDSIWTDTSFTPTSSRPGSLASRTVDRSH